MSNLHYFFKSEININEFNKLIYLRIMFDFRMSFSKKTD